MAKKFLCRINELIKPVKVIPLLIPFLSPSPAQALQSRLIGIAADAERRTRMLGKGIRPPAQSPLHGNESAKRCGGGKEGMEPAPRGAAAGGLHRGGRGRDDCAAREAIEFVRADDRRRRQRVGPGRRDIIRMIVRREPRDGRSDAGENAAREHFGFTPFALIQPRFHRTVAGEGKLTAGLALRPLEHDFANRIGVNGAGDAVEDDIGDSELSDAAFAARLVINRLREAGALFAVKLGDLNRRKIEIDEIGDWRAVSDHHRGRDRRLQARRGHRPARRSGLVSKVIGEIGDDLRFVGDVVRLGAGELRTLDRRGRAHRRHHDADSNAGCRQKAPHSPADIRNKVPLMPHRRVYRHRYAYPRDRPVQINTRFLAPRLSAGPLEPGSLLHALVTDAFCDRLISLALPEGSKRRAPRRASPLEYGAREGAAQIKNAPQAGLANTR